MENETYVGSSKAQEGETAAMSKFKHFLLPGLDQEALSLYLEADLN